MYVPTINSIGILFFPYYSDRFIGKLFNLKFQEQVQCLKPRLLAPTTIYQLSLKN